MFSKRLTELRKKASMSQQELALLVGVTRATYASYESGRRVPDLNVGRRLAECLMVSLDYLTGTSSDPRPAGLILAQLEPEIGSAHVRQVPYIAAKNQDPKCPAPLVCDDLLELPAHWSIDCVMQVNDNALSGIGVAKGDLAAIRASQKACKGQLVVAVIDGLTPIVRFYWEENDTSFLKSANPKYADIPPSDYRIIGRVLGLLKKPPAYREIIALGSCMHQVISATSVKQ